MARFGHPNMAGTKRAVEVEIGFASVSWANVNPLIQEPDKVISNGCRILHDPSGHASSLVFCGKASGTAVDRRAEVKNFGAPRDAMPKLAKAPSWGRR